MSGSDASDSGHRPKTKLSKTGQPTMGTPIEVRLTDGTYERAKVVAKGFGHDGHTLVSIMVEWPDGVRQWCNDFPDLEWRPCA